MAVIVKDNYRREKKSKENKTAQGGRGGEEGKTRQTADQTSWQCHWVACRSDQLLNLCDPQFLCIKVHKSIGAGTSGIVDHTNFESLVDNLISSQSSKHCYNLETEKWAFIWSLPILNGRILATNFIKHLFGLHQIRAKNSIKFWDGK